MKEHEAERLAEPVVKEIVNCISEKRYSDIGKSYIVMAEAFM